MQPNQHSPQPQTAANGQSQPRKSPVVGIIGGIGSGKTAVARYAAERLGWAVIEADPIGHQVLQEPAVIHALTTRFGTSILDDSGQIRRPALAQLVFGTSETTIIARQELEQVVHPRLKAKLMQAIEEYRLQQTGGGILLDAALLLEAGWQTLCDAIIWIETPLEVRRWRVLNQRGWSAEELARREASQWPLAQKRACATAKIENLGTLEAAGQALQILLQQEFSR